ncbi:conserved protein of unknown function [Kyrpidia spormannii]|uniref:Uncharacterized protein n=2 Tax=Kyrpidia spormannii TaxID=2055160 RepID=A0ACA8Z606_9BACL|nr:conserved protein of unknown function [Kyrpidia spormannii]CAB3391277.1 conserved protein of unknown function [Kyrpidia spormannii]
MDCRVVHVEHILEEFPHMRQAVLEIDARTIGIDQRLQHVETNMVTKADLAFYDRKIGEHDREIYMMKNR